MAMNPQEVHKLYAVASFCDNYNDILQMDTHSSLTVFDLHQFSYSRPCMEI